MWSLLVETFVKWNADRAPRLGAALAYYTVFAVAPGLVFIIAVSALFLGEEAAQGQIINEVQDLSGSRGPRRFRPRSRTPATPVTASSPPFSPRSRSWSGSGASSESCRMR